MAAHESGYALTEDGVYLAYQLVGDGAIDVLYQPDWPGNIDMEWEFPSSRAALEGMSAFARVIVHEHRGVGLSSRNVPIPNLETRVNDAIAVLDAVGSERAVLTGILASGAVNALLAVTRPERAAGLTWLDPNPRTAWAPDNPWGRTVEDLEAEIADLRSWGTSAYGQAFATEQASYGNLIPEVEAAIFAKASRNACTPDIAIELARMWMETDVRGILPTIAVPTLILAHTATDEVDRRGRFARRSQTLSSGRSRVPRGPSRLLPCSSRRSAVSSAFSARPSSSTPFSRRSCSPTSSSRAATKPRSATGLEGARRASPRPRPPVARPLARRRERHRRRRFLRHLRRTGARHPLCARDHRCVRELEYRGPCGNPHRRVQVIDGKVGGVGVSIGSRVAAQAKPSQVLVSQTVKDLVAGSRLTFVDAGEHELKGISGQWRLFSATDDA